MAYTSKDQIDNLYSQAGVELRLDDESSLSEQDEIYTEVIEYADEYMDSHLIPYYTTAQLATSKWVKRRSTAVACWYLSQRRGDPMQFVGLMERLQLDMELLRQGKIVIPGLQSRAGRQPTLSNYVIDDLRHFQNKHRVQGSISTGDPYAKQPLGYEPASPFL